MRSLSALNALSCNPHDEGDGSIVIPVAQKTRMKFREVKKRTQDATAQGRSQGSKSGVCGSQPCTLRYGAALPQEPAEEVLPHDPYPVFAAETLGEDIVTLLNLPI